MSTLSDHQKSVRPIVFDDEHSGLNFNGRRNTVSRHNVVIDGHAGEKSVEIIISMETFKEMALQFLGKTVGCADDFVVLVARNADNAPHRFIIQSTQA